MVKCCLLKTKIAIKSKSNTKGKCKICLASRCDCISVISCEIKTVECDMIIIMVLKNTVVL